MIIEITIPSPGESISEVTMANWMVENGSFVEKDQEIAEVESDKATLPLIAKESGKIELLIEVGDTAKVGDVACKIDTSQQGEAKKTKPVEVKKDAAQEKTETERVVEKQPESETKNANDSHLKISPLAQKLMSENQLSVDELITGLKRIGKGEVEQVLSLKGGLSALSSPGAEVSREVDRKQMTSLRKKLSQRLVSVKNETAMLTTFNEVDMSKVMELRSKYQKQFIEKHGVKLGFMSFFTKAAAVALKLFPNVNSMIDGDDIVNFNYADIGIAVQTDKGLMVPVLRNVEALGLAQIENQIGELAAKARKFRISIDEMSGGTFTITNGGIFGSMLSTPINNPPQAGILGMHNIVERPVAINGKVEIRPIMYVALSYDHRVIDGRDSVGFLKTIKELIENPVKLLSAGQEPEMLLLEI
ncbi:MAG: 2-oxoglutarate dehydrogenase complex dihydrolipoyllysine-residue succinyltransferase [Bacteroidales bacterium]|nr:2-oxoglutarate dehydrogenase complex dihydrolipoyllysine-residue succinyltransferase [Bacteroidales bacterium]